MNTREQTECPMCGEMAEAEFVDNGVGLQQVSPFRCEHCGWEQGDEYRDILLDEPK